MRYKSRSFLALSALDGVKRLRVTTRYCSFLFPGAHIGARINFKAVDFSIIRFKDSSPPVPPYGEFVNLSTHFAIALAFHSIFYTVKTLKTHSIMKTRNIPQILSSIREIAGLGLPQELMWVWMALDTNSLLAEI